MFNMPKGPFCQSCGMPMEPENLFGSESDGSKSAEYCIYCYKDGDFTAPDITLDQMKDKAVNILVDKKGMQVLQAKMLVNMFIPKLKRWN